MNGLLINFLYVKKQKIILLRKVEKLWNGYHKIMKLYILPYLRKKKILYFHQITEDILKELIRSVNGIYSKNHTYVVLSMILNYAVKKHKIKENLLKYVDKPIIPKKKSTEKKAIVPFNRIELWCKKLENEAEERGDLRNKYLLFEVCMITGLRIEEGCRTKMELS